MNMKTQKKKIIIIICFICYYTLLFSEDIKYGCSYQYPSEYGSIIINKDSYSKKSLSGKEDIITKNFKSQIYEESNYTWLENIEKTNEKYILLTCSVNDLNFLTLVCSRDTSESYFKNSEVDYVYCDNYSKYKYIPSMRGFTVIKADSFLVEKLKDGTELKYLPEYTWVEMMPWATKGDSPKKTIYLEPYSKHIYNTIVIANGFTCFEKPYLYEQNSRAKKIRVTWGNNSKDFELQDTPNFQPLVLTDKEDFFEGPIQIEILEVYKGSKYSDVVISGIYYVNAPLK